MEKAPAYRWRDATRLASELKQRGPDIARELEPKMAAVLREGETMPDLAHLLDVLGRMVVAEARELEAKDRRKALDATRAHSARFDLRRDAMPVLRSRVKEVRGWMKSHMHPKKLQLVLDHKGRTPRSDEGLENLARGLVRRLSALKPIETPAGPVDPAGWADYLREPLQQATGLLGALEEETDARKESTKTKRRAMRAFDKLFRRVARIGWIFSHMAGLAGIAEQLVYKGGRPGVKTKKPRNGPRKVV